MFSELFAPVSIGVRTIAKTVRILERNHPGENGEAAITVANEGFLEHEESFNNLFAVKNSTKVNGLGLGLAIAARVVERWGGQLSIRQHNKEVIACILLPSL